VGEREMEQKVEVSSKIAAFGSSIEISFDFYTEPICGDYSNKGDSKWSI
jgi:hypothetical protein